MQCSTADRPVHFTASAIVIVRSQVLLVHHARLGLWVPPGGHVEPFELPHQTARREVREETGLVVRILSSESMPDVPFDEEAYFIEQPLFVQCVSALENSQMFNHFDITFLAALDDREDILPELICGPGAKACAWVRLDELEEWPVATNVREAVAMAVKKLDKMFKTSPSFWL